MPPKKIECVNFAWSNFSQCNIFRSATFCAVPQNRSAKARKGAFCAVRHFGAVHHFVRCNIDWSKFAQNPNIVSRKGNIVSDVPNMVSDVTNIVSRSMNIVSRKVNLVSRSTSPPTSMNFSDRVVLNIFSDGFAHILYWTWVNAIRPLTKLLLVQSICPAFLVTLTFSV